MGQMANSKNGSGVEGGQVSATMPLTWTNSPPTVPGWYWKRGNFSGQVLMVEVQPHNKDQELGWWEGAEFCADFYDFNWSGPIPEPQEPPSGPSVDKNK